MAQSSDDESTVSLNVKPPEFFTFNPTDWSTLRKRFERYRSLSKLHNATGKKQVDMLIYCMGEKAEQILESFNRNVSDITDYDIVFNKFERYFIPKKNLIFERARFLKRKQGTSETVENFVTALHYLAQNCEWGQIEEQMILMVLIIGMCDETFSDRLQLESDLKLETAVRKSEELVRQKQELKLSYVDAVRKVNSTAPSHPKFNSTNNNQINNYPYRPNYNAKYTPKTLDSCFWYGTFPPHHRNMCSARNHRCGICGKIGHFPKVCRTKKVNQIEFNDFNSCENDQSQNTETFIASVTSNSSNSSIDPCTITLNINDSDNISFKIDTGADVTVLPASIELSKKIRLKPTF